MEVRFFGEFEVVQADGRVPVRGTKQRALLALLALHRGKPVAADRLIDALWDRALGQPGQCPPGTDRSAAADPRAGGDPHQ